MTKPCQKVASDGETIHTGAFTLRPPFALAHRPRLKQVQPAVGKGLPSLTPGGFQTEKNFDKIFARGKMKNTDKKHDRKNKAEAQHKADNTTKRTKQKKCEQEAAKPNSILIDEETIKEDIKELRKHVYGKRFLIALIILISLCGIVFGLSKAQLIPVTITYLEDRGLLIEFTDAAEFYRQKFHPEEFDEQTESEQEAMQQEIASVSEVELQQDAQHVTHALNLPDALEIPLCPAGSHDHERREFSGFTACYRESYEQPEWVAYTITPEKLVKGAERSNNFRSDPQISTGSATPNDYKSSGYDRGHLAPAADMSYSETTMKESFYMSNMSPQEPAFNRGVWNNLENDVRAIAAGCDCLYVITGPVLEKPASQYAHIGTNEVSVPEYYYKVLLAAEFDDETDGVSVTAYAYLVPNGKTDENPDKFICTIDDVEKRTGIDFFSLLEDSLENMLESGSMVTTEILN